MDEVFDRVVATAKRYGLKELATRMGCTEAALRRELEEESGWGMRLWTALRILQVTGDLSSLEQIEKEALGVAEPIVEGGE